MLEGCHICVGCNLKVIDCWFAIHLRYTKQTDIKSCMMQWSPDLLLLRILLFSSAA